MMEIKEKTPKRMSIRNVRGAELPPAWAKHMGLETHPDQLVDITITLASGKAERRKASKAELQKLIQRYQSKPLIDPHFSEDDLYDEKGLPV